MHCEIEFLPVGEKSKAGDAIVVRYGGETNYSLMLVDGGHADTGTEIVEHLKANFGQNPIIEHVVLTHSDADHASGLRAVLKEVAVRNLWLHVPWLHAEASKELFASKQWTTEGLAAAIKKEYDIVSEIIDLALAAKVEIHFPFVGWNIGPFRVCSPTVHAYNHLMPQFDRTPDVDEAAVRAANMWIGKQSIVAKIMQGFVSTVQNWIHETWENERLREGGATGASNETSVVLYGVFDEGNVLLTGDAGINALSWAAENAQQANLPLQNFSFVQIPHHGSRNNVSPSILTQLLGPIQDQTASARFAAFVSAPKDDEKHPRRIVINAFKRRGGTVVATQGLKKVHWGGFAPRINYSSAQELPFYSQVEDYD